MPRPDNSYRNACIIEALNNGMFAGDVAAMMGVSKNVVIGVSNRAGLSKPGRSADGVRNAAAKGRLNPVRGEAHPNSVLTEEAVRSIRERYALYQQNRPKVIARELGIAARHVQLIVSGKIWGHVQ